MKVKIDKERFHNILLKLFSSMIGRITTREDEDGKYIELFDKNGDIWLKGSVITKRCKKLIIFHIGIMEDLERFVPVLRKKQYAKTLIDYVNYHTGIKGDCAEFEYNWEYYHDEDGDEIGSSKRYKYRKRKKK